MLLYRNARLEVHVKVVSFLGLKGRVDLILPSICEVGSVRPPSGRRMWNGKS